MWDYIGLTYGTLKWLLIIESVSRLVVSDSLRPHELQPAGSSVWGFSRQEYWNGLPCLPPGDLPNPEITPRSLTLQADSLLSEPPGKPKSIRMGSLSLFQGVFPTQESDWNLLHCGRILYQLSYQGSLARSRCLESTWWGSCLFSSRIRVTVEGNYSMCYSYHNL